MMLLLHLFVVVSALPNPLLPGNFYPVRPGISSELSLRGIIMDSQKSSNMIAAVDNQLDFRGSQ